MLQRQVTLRTEKLNAATMHLRKSYEAIPKAVLVNGIDRRVSGANENFEELFKLQPKESQDVLDILRSLEDQILDKAAYEEFLEEAICQDEHPVTVQLRMSDGGQIIDAFSGSIVDKSGKSFGRLWTFEDVTEKLRIENELVHAQKMAIVEQLSGELHMTSITC